MPAFPAVIDLATLDGTDGFRLDGIDTDDLCGHSVSAGDINGDGFNDIIIGAWGGDPRGKTYAGETYVVFGRTGEVAPAMSLSNLNGDNGFRLLGIDALDQSGFSVSSAGDLNGDGFDDIVIGAHEAEAGGHRYAGESYVVFGKADGFAANLDLAELNGENGFRMTGVHVRDRSGFSVSSAGDVNGDGVDDIIVGAIGDIFTDDRGQTYVVFGKTGGFDARLDLDTLDGTNGFRMAGVDSGDRCGYSVSSAGDVNGDGVDDIIIGAPSANPEGGVAAGASYVVFGRNTAREGDFAATFDLSTLDGTNGFRLDGLDLRDRCGQSVSSAGDVNGDGFDDLIIGAYNAERRQLIYSGESYVVFGRADEFEPSLDLASLDGSNGFRLRGLNEGDRNGSSVSSAGDVNGDGFDDIIIGAFGVEREGEFFVGASYVVFGKAGGFEAEFDLATLDGSNGFRVDGIDTNDMAGRSVSSAGDINGDGFDDIVIGAAGSGPGIDGAGQTFVIFGRAPTEAVTRVGSAADQTIRGGDFDDTLRGKQGDDVLAGGGGHDRLAGGKGADEFLLASLNAADADIILDFGRGDDRIALDGGVFGLAEGDLAAKRFVVGDTATDANDRVIYDDATGKLFFDADGTGAQAQVLIATLTGAPVLATSDFVVI